MARQHRLSELVFGPLGDLNGLGQECVGRLAFALEQRDAPPDWAYARRRWWWWWLGRRDRFTRHRVVEWIGLPVIYLRLAGPIATVDRP